MKLYVCWGTSGNDHHACAKVYLALIEAGYSPEIIKAKGQGRLPKFLQTKIRKEIYSMTGSYFTPVLVLVDGKIINESNNILHWLKSNPPKKS